MKKKIIYIIIAFLIILITVIAINVLKPKKESSKKAKDEDIIIDLSDGIDNKKEFLEYINENYDGKNYNIKLEQDNKEKIIYTLYEKGTNNKITQYQYEYKTKRISIIDPDAKMIVE